MEQFVNTITGFPTVVFTVLLGFTVLYWLLVILGALDIDVIDFDVDADFDLDVDADATGVSGLAGLLSTLGLSGVPLTVSFSLLIVFSWLISYFASAYIMVLVPGSILLYVVGAVLIVACLAVALPITVQIIKPLRGLFVITNAKSKAQYVGSTCKVTTSNVTASFGQAEIDDGEAGIIIAVRMNKANELKKGDQAVVISYDKDKNVYEVEPEHEFIK